MLPVDPQTLTERCRQAGLKATPQRLAVYRALLESDTHPSPESLYHEVRRALPSISLATIYKTLDSLEEAGLVSEVSLLSEAKRYDAHQSPHHHLVCRSCKGVFDHEDPSLDALLPKRALGAFPGFRGFIVQEVRVQLVGLCAACARAEGDDPSQPRRLRAPNQPKESV